jgi:plastocyanin
MLTRSVAILMAAILIIDIAAFTATTTVSGQQTEIQVQSEGELEARLNGTSFTTGDRITVSGTVEDPDTESFVTIQVIDPESEIILQGAPRITPGNNTFTFSFVAGDEENFDSDEPVVESGDYRTVVTYFENSGDFDIYDVEFPFEYSAPTVEPLIRREGASGATGIRPQEGELPVLASSMFESNVDGIRVGVPDGWVFEDVNNTDPGILQSEQSYGGMSLVELCPLNQATPQIGTPRYICPEYEEGLDIISVWRFANLKSKPEFDSIVVQNKNITTDDLAGYYFEFLRQKANYTNFRVLENTSKQVNVIDPQTNQAIGRAPASYIEMTFLDSSGTRSERDFAFLVVRNEGGNTTGYVLIPQTSLLTATGKLPPEFQVVFDSFELIEVNDSSNAVTLPPPLPPTNATVAVSYGSSFLTDNAYQPNPVSVSVEGKIIWKNEDFRAHSITSGEKATPNGKFDSGILAPAATFEHTFTEAGEYSYFCTLHPNMVGKVIAISRPPILHIPTLPNID